jgi:hypothetical protein
MLLAYIITYVQICFHNFKTMLFNFFNKWVTRDKEMRTLSSIFFSILCYRWVEKQQDRSATQTLDDELT